VISSHALAHSGGLGHLIGSSVDISCRASSAVSSEASSVSSHASHHRHCDRTADCQASHAECQRGGECPTPTECREGEHCPVRPPTLLRQGAELVVRDRVVELRQELALGRGPVIATLATTQGLSAAELGRTLREHRVELAALIGDASDAQWPTRFLDRVERLCTPS
jgi:hypothetical protein